MTPDELAIRLAPLLWGWTNCRISAQGRLAGTPPGEDYRETIAHPATTVDGMMAVIERMLDLGWAVRMQVRTDEWCGAKFRKGKAEITWARDVAVAETLPRAVCLAALSALER